MTVCILTKIPIFVIGETGSSKSLALHLISSNLRGSESDDDYFKSLPKVHIVPYLCSSSSTSDGITKIFDKANKYQETSSDVINVALFDHVGFAESNSSNPLKLLHTLLEPIYPATGPTVSFVGLSNWRLDISKSSRAILVQRPKFDLNDLVNINTKFIKFNEAEASKSLAEAYLEYKQHNQTLSNFYGLRDYYASLKMLSLTPAENIQIALARSYFPDDQDDYSSKVLSKIMTCISTGKPLILTNLEKIYGKLYNLWNQNNIVENTEQKVYEENSNFAYHISLKCESK
ncbi:unnamed protein product [Rhizophagus irregularis]|nr:unnamed protein product [Rhizophagus irregularis]